MTEIRVQISRLTRAISLRLLVGCVTVVLLARVVFVTFWPEAVDCDGKWFEQENLCVELDCAATSSCGTRGKFESYCGNVRIGMPRDEIELHLGTPMKRTPELMQYQSFTGVLQVRLRENTATAFRYAIPLRMGTYLSWTDWKYTGTCFSGYGAHGAATTDYESVLGNDKSHSVAPRSE